MSLATLQVCKDSTHWLQESKIHEEPLSIALSPTGEDEILTSSMTLLERKSQIRPQQDQEALKCPRCDSTHTKFCYYNNYSLSQPRYFCKACRRYWTRGGTLRNIPIGGGCRKNKKVITKKSTSSSFSNDKINHDDHQYLINNTQNSSQTSLSSLSSTTNSHLFLHDQLQFSHLSNLLGNQATILLNGSPNFNVNESRPIDSMETSESKLVEQRFLEGSCSNTNSTTRLMENCQRLMLPYEDDHHEQNAPIDFKPKSLGYLSYFGPSWTTNHGMINGFEL